MVGTPYHEHAEHFCSVHGGKLAELGTEDYYNTGSINNILSDRGKQEAVIVHIINV